MKKVLMISPFFIPRRRVGALRAFRFAIHLKEFGYQPVILSIKDKNGKITDREKELLDGIPVFSITPPFDKTSEGNKSPGKLSNKGKKIYFSPSAWVDKHTPLDTWLYLFLLRYPSIKKIARECNPDVIWATGDPWSSLWLGRKIARELKQPFVADFRDPWIPGDVSLRRRSPISALLDRKAERNIVNDADRMVFTSRSTEKEYIRYYGLDPKTTKTIYNSNSRLLEGDYIQTGRTVLNRSVKFALLFYGRFRALSPVEPVINTIRKIEEQEGSEITGLLEVHSFGRPDPHQMELIEQAGLEKVFIYHDPIPPEKSTSVLNEADLLLLTTHRDRKLVIPAKLWDYLSADTPVLSITPNPEIGEIIRRAGKGFHTGPDNIGKAADCLAEQIRKKMKGEMDHQPVHKRNVSRFFYESKETTRELAELFENLLKDAK